jgi:hypothetical protein
MTSRPTLTCRAGQAGPGQRQMTQPATEVLLAKQRRKKKKRSRTGRNGNGPPVRRSLVVLAAQVVTLIRVLVEIWHR